MSTAVRARKVTRVIVAAALALVVLLVSMAMVVPVENAQALECRNRKAKNIIVMISDGCGYNQIEATNYYEAGKKKAQEYERFPVRLGMSTYEVEDIDPDPNTKVPKILGYNPARAWSEFEYVSSHPPKGDGYTDSASAATAMSTGTKTYNGYIGKDIDGNSLLHIAQRAEELGMSTGVVTSVELSHATPAGFVAHNVSRNNYESIAKEMINDSATDVIMGCGNPWFDNDGNAITTPSNFKYVGGQATWDALVAGTAGGSVDADHNGKLDDTWKLVQTRDEFKALMKGRTPKRVCGVPQVYETLQQARSGDGKAAPYVVPLNQRVPTLEEMTRGALNVLDNDRDGFFLMIEGGAVDWASHASQSGRMIEEEMDFNDSVDAVIDWVRRKSNWNETLLIVTGDHECGYLCGPGSKSAQSMQPIVNNGKGVLPGMEWNSGDHTNLLVPLFAKGSASYALYGYADEIDPVRGRYIDNTEIAEMIFRLLN